MKIKAKLLYDFLNKKFPMELMAIWDKAGLQISDVFNLENQDEISGVVTCLDVTIEVVDFAIENNCNLIISRHPFIFMDFELEMKNIAKAQLYKKLVENKIQIYSIHTNYDISENQSLVEIINEHLKIDKFERKYEDASVYTFSLKESLSMVDFINSLKLIFKSDYFNSNFDICEEDINEFILSQGASGSLMNNLSLKDTFFITGEAKWSDYIYAKENNIKLLELGHYMENYFIHDIKNKINNEFENQIPCFDFDIKNMVKNLV